MSAFRTLRPYLPIILGACLMLSLANGLRQSFGIFMSPLTRDLGMAVADFTLAVAVQNLLWGVTQAPAGALAVRYGYKPLMLAGGLLYVAGLLVLTQATGFFDILLGAGILVGLAMSCGGSAIAHAVAARPVPLEMRSLILGFVSSTGSLGSMLLAPFGQTLVQEYGWRIGVGGFAVCALLMLPAAWFAGRADKIPLVNHSAADRGNARQALGMALRNPMYVVLTVAFFVCGMQLIFLTTHLPAYLEICGMDPMLSAQALGMIGLFNVLGSMFFGWAGGRWNKLVLLGGIYVGRSIAVAWYFMALPTPTTTLIFAALMGFTWLGVVPLVAGWIAEEFGLRWLAMLNGVAFVGHQVGSFVGAYGGGVIYDALGSYDAAWQGAVVIGFVAGVVQAGFAWWRPRGRPPLRPA